MGSDPHIKNSDMPMDFSSMKFGGPTPYLGDTVHQNLNFDDINENLNHGAICIDMPVIQRPFIPQADATSVKPSLIFVPPSSCARRSRPALRDRPLSKHRPPRPLRSPPPGIPFSPDTPHQPIAALIEHQQRRLQGRGVAHGERCP